jgi:hypothetical protein
MAAPKNNTMTVAAAKVMTIVSMLSPQVSRIGL